MKFILKKKKPSILLFRGCFYISLQFICAIKFYWTLLFFILIKLPYPMNRHFYASLNIVSSGQIQIGNWVMYLITLHNTVHRWNFSVLGTLFSSLISYYSVSFLTSIFHSLRFKKEKSLLFCGGLILASCQAPTKLLYHSSFLLNRTEGQ